MPIRSVHYYAMIGAAVGARLQKDYGLDPYKLSVSVLSKIVEYKEEGKTVGEIAFLLANEHMKPIDNYPIVEQKEDK